MKNNTLIILIYISFVVVSVCYMLMHRYVIHDFGNSIIYLDRFSGFAYTIKSINSVGSDNHYYRLEKIER